MVFKNRKYKDSVFTDLFYTDLYARENLKQLSDISQENSIRCDLKHLFVL